MRDKNPAKIKNDLPDVEKRVQELKSRKEHQSPTDDAITRQREAAVERATEDLPKK